MQTVVWTGPRRMEMQEASLPELKAGEVLIKVHAVGICGSELSGFLGENSLRVPPLVMGHEFSGTVAAVGEGAALALETPVTVNPLITCGECFFCTRGQENLCVTRKLVGVHQPGAFAEYVAVPERNCVPLPGGEADLLVGSLAEPLACGVRTARLGGVGPGSRVMILGAGAIGLLAITAVKQAGGEVVLVSELNTGRLAEAEKWGAQNVCSPRDTDPAALARSLTGGLGVDVVIDAVGATATRQTGIMAARLGGRVVWVGLHTADSQVPANHIVRSETQVTGSFAYTHADFAQAVEMLAAGLVQPSGPWLEQRALDQCEASFVELIDANPTVSKILLNP